MHNMLDIVWEPITTADLPQDLFGLTELCISFTFFIHKEKFY
jgi:hypothetical protein